MNETSVLIIGGGITGLAAAFRLQRLAPAARVVLIEQDTYLGGKVITEQVDGFVLEGGADSFLSRKPRGVGLCEELGIAERLIDRIPHHNKTYVMRRHQLHPLPEGLTGMIPTNLDTLTESQLISPAGKARLVEELTQPPAPPAADESLAHFMTRRLGREAYEQLVEPLMSGIYAGDGEQLSLAATFPHLRQLELEHGSLIKGLLAGQGNGRLRDYPPFVSFPGGMVEMIRVLVQQLSHTMILTGVAVAAIRTDGPGYIVTLSNGRLWKTKLLILATPAYVTAELLSNIDSAMAEAHAAIPYASSATINLAYRASDLPHRLDGYGYVVPSVEGTDVLACTWTSGKWPGRAPEGFALLRVYVGRYGRREVLQDSDEALLALARAEVRKTMKITAVPHLKRVCRWPLSMPQYTLGHLERLARIDACLANHPGLLLAGAAYRGVGIPDCIQSGEAAAEAAVRYLYQP